LKIVAQRLGVAAISEGSVQRAADKVRVNVQLIDARADAHLWANSYDRDIKDVFVVKSEISQKIANALQAKLSPNEASSLTIESTQNLEVHELLLKGEYEPREIVRTLQGLLSLPAGYYISLQQLKIDPVWDPIRHDPGFQQLLAGKELIGPNK
jgi:hypothetical protein